MAFDSVAVLPEEQAQAVIRQRLGNTYNQISVDHFDEENAIYECTIDGEQADICLSEQDAMTYTGNQIAHSDKFFGTFYSLFVEHNGLFVHVDGCGLDDADNLVPHFTGEAV